MHRLEARYGIGFWQLSHLRSGRAKSVDLSLYARIRGAYLDYCERQISTLQHELEIEKAMNADYPDVGGETVFESEPRGDGIFFADERMEHLTNAVAAIKARIVP